MTIFMTTHYLEEADHACDRIAIIDHGRIIAVDSPENLKESLGGDIIEVGISRAPTDELTESLRQVPNVREVVVKPDGYRIKVMNGEETAPKVIETLRSANAGLTRISLTKPTLDEVYLERTGRSIRAEETNIEDFRRHRMTMRRARP
jgi:ABC-2 type transport system ATP-binding protein